MILKPLLTTCVLSGTLLITTAYAADNANEALATVNNQAITQQDYDGYLKSRNEQLENKDTPPDQAVVIQELINRELIKQDALKKGIEQVPQFVTKLEQIRGELLMSLALQDYLEKHPLDDATLKREYDQRVAEAPQEYNVSHILVATEEAAKAILAELDQGKDFGELAKTKSIDAESAKNKGELGWVNRQKVVSNFADAIEKMKKGERSKAPVKTEFGWHLIQVQDVRKIQAPAFEQVKDRIKTVLQSQQMQEYVSSLKKEAKIEVLKKSPPPTTIITPVEQPEEKPATPPAVTPAAPPKTE